MKFLITGACGVTSRAIARSLRLSSRFKDCQLIGTDICENPYGLFEGLFDKIYRVPRVTQEGYAHWMSKICQDEEVSGAIAIPELEVLYWADKQFPAAIALPPPRFCHLAVSKRRLYETLAGSNLVPSFRIVSREQLLQNSHASQSFPCWIRDFSEGTTSGKGALLARAADDLIAWAMLNADIQHFMLSEYLPGRNFACHLLYDRGDLVKIACYERLEYFMGRTVMSGVSGNISKGRLLNDARLDSISVRAVEHLCSLTGEVMHGMVAVDLREDQSGTPMITEINLRHVAASYSFAAAGFNLAEAHALLTLGATRSELGPREAMFTSENMILRDIDGPPVWIDKYRALQIGEHR